MIQVTDEERAYIQRDSRSLKARLLLDGKELDGVLRSLTISKGSCGGSNFEPGCVYSNSCECEIDYLTTDITGKKITVQLGFDLTGEDHWFTVATGYVDKPARKGKRTTAEIVGVIASKLGKKFTGGNFSDVNSLVAHISSVAGCTITLEDGMENLTLPEADLSKKYYREVLADIAGLYFGYATETPDGNIILHTYNYNNGSIDAYTSRISEDIEAYDKVSVQGIAVSSTDEKDYIYGELQNASISNPLMTQTAFDTYAKNYIGFEYEPYNLGLTLGDFTLEPTDTISIVDSEGVEHKNLKCMSIKHTFNGGLKTDVSAPTLATGEDYSRSRVEQESSFAYDAVMKGDIKTNGDEENTTKGVKFYNISGDLVQNGYFWTEDGAVAHMYADFSVPLSLALGSYGGDTKKLTYRGKITVEADDDFYNKICPIATASFNIFVPVAYHAEKGEFSAGGIFGLMTISFSNFSSTGQLDYTLSLQYSNADMVDLVGKMCVYDTDTKQMKSLVNADFGIQGSWPVKHFVDDVAEKDLKS